MKDTAEVVITNEDRRSILYDASERPLYRPTGFFAKEASK